MYVTDSSINSVLHPLATAESWRKAALNYDEITKNRIVEIKTSAERIWNEIQAQQVTLDQIPASARKALGDERALDVGKNFVRAGLDPALMEKLPSQVASELNTWADIAKKFGDKDCVKGGCPATGSSQAVDGAPATGGSHGGGDDVTTELPPVKVTAPAPSPLIVEILDQTIKLKMYLDTLPVEQAQLALLAAQAVMGPFKAVLSVAINVAVSAYAKDKYDALKEELAVFVTAKLTESERKVIQDAHDAAKTE